MAENSLLNNNFLLNYSMPQAQIAIKTPLPPQPELISGLPAKHLLLIKMFLVIPFGVLLSTLVLYMTQQLHKPDTAAINITAIFMGSTGFLRIIAGYICDRLISPRQLILLSAVFMFIGCILMCNPHDLYWGIASITLASALTIAVNCLITKIYQANDIQREAVFLRIYSGMNVGYIIAFAISGYYQLSHHYQQLFLVSAVFSLLTLFLIIKNWKDLSYPQPCPTNNKNYFVFLNKKKNSILTNRFAINKNIMGNITGLAFLAAAFFILYEIIHAATSNVSQPIFLISNLVIIAAITGFVLNKSNKSLKTKLMICFTFIVPAILFATIQNLTPMLLTLFIQRKVDLHSFGITIAPQWAQLINTATIIVGGPYLSYLFKKLRLRGMVLTPLLQFSFGLLLIIFSLFILIMGSWVSTHLLSFNWIIASYIFQGFAELLIVPIGFSMIATIAPDKYQGLMMGNWLLLLSVSALFAGDLSNLILHFNNML